MEGSDAAIVAQAVAGDREAFRSLVERHSHGVFRLAFRMTGNEHDAEEVVQETFLRAYRRLDKFEERSSFKTWVTRIAINCSLDFVRSRARHDDRREDVRVTGEMETLDPLDNVETQDPAPDRLVLSGEVKQKVSAALTRLGPLERAAFVMRHLEGHSIEEISKALGLRTSAAKNNIFRAVQKLRKELAPLMSPSR